MRQENEALLGENEHKLKSVKIGLDELAVNLKKSGMEKNKKKYFSRLIIRLEKLIDELIGFNFYTRDYINNIRSFEESGSHLKKINYSCNLIQTEISALKFEQELKEGAGIRNAIITNEGIYAEVYRIKHLRNAGEQEPLLQKQKFDELFRRIELLVLMLNRRITTE